MQLTTIETGLGQIAIDASAHEAANAATAAAAAKRSLAATIAAKHNATVQAALVSQPADKPADTSNRKQRRANAANAAKRVAAKPAATAKPAKPTQAEREAAQRDNADALYLQRAAAAKAVAAFYSGPSKPFKAASDRFADFNAANGKAATVRQAGLFLALITYGRGNLLSDGSFVRGAFRVPAKLVNANAPDGATVAAQPESGCLCNAIGRAVDYVSGPRSGREQRDAIYRLRPAVVIAEIQSAFGDAVAADARKLLASYRKRA